MKNKNQIKAIKDFIVTAEKSLKNAKKLLTDLINDNELHLNKTVELDVSGLHSYSSEDSKIIEGVFTGEDMYGVDGEKYPIPANYASKSKMVQGDKLKLTIAGNGKMLYKQISPIEREITTGLLTEDKGKYQAVAQGKTYDLLTAAVTHCSANIGDNLSLIIPKGKDATFAAIDSVIA
ncbi:MAG: hypothetical protein Q9M94_04475 [Candidatus Gracilibacteria bacterium]|nr:hypothetical protein [Candidatus Gracilibacteria bacterium]MDQ7022098.1 hypothetical protein [Candidatus Gracilibacteria bacterium]